MAKTRRMACVAALFAAGACVLGTSAAFSSGVLTISQNDRRFSPDVVFLKPDETLRVLNDDRFIHHVYFTAGSRTFDSGDQRPGQTVNLSFPGEGLYDISCAIHPKMKLKVAVGDAAAAQLKQADLPAADAETPLIRP